MTSPFSADEALMARIADGDAVAFRKLTDEHLKALVTFSQRLVGNHAEAEEVVQETFLRVWQKADSYEPKAKLSTWLYTIARNVSIDRMRKRARKEEAFELDDERDQSPDSAVPSQLLIQKQAQLGLEQALVTLPERQRTAIALCHEQGLDNPQIAEILECSVEAVESLLSRGRRTLREILSSPSPKALSK